MCIKYTLEILILYIATLIILKHNWSISLERYANNMKVTNSIPVWAINFKLIRKTYF